YLAPPNNSPSDQTAGAGLLSHANLVPATDIGGMASTRARDIDVAVVTELPTANGSFVTGDPGVASDDLWVAPQVSTDMAAALKLNTSRPLFFVRPDGTDAMSGSTAAVTTALTDADRKVESTASMSLTNVRFLPTTFISDTTAERSVVDITSFSASVSCKSTADSSTATKSATWSATLRYWRDTTDNGVLDGSYTTLDLSGAAASDLLAEVGNPLVYDGALPQDDVFLFEDTATGRRGYLSSWGSLFDASTTGVTGDASGEVTNAAIDGALSIKSVATDTTADSGVQLDIGKLSCEAVDSR
ncbi:MAG: hypothetical protein M3457_22660, partial [Chloroflexota bacterium]|nr:hypothetical protein [Chloroflexota bacterium]